jgi:branched-chain amino acid transport system permease protein
MFMVILGGIATSAGPLLGAAALLLLEDVLQGWSLLPREAVRDHWQLYLGVILILVVVFARRGLAGMIPGKHE